MLHLLLTVLLFAPPARLSAPPEITSELEEGGFQDLAFFISSHEVAPDGAQDLICQGLHHGRALEFRVRLAPSWDPKRIKDIPAEFFKGNVLLASTGSRSDAFIAALATVYKSRRKPLHMRTAVPFTGVSLEGAPHNLAAGPVKIKLFFDPGGESKYAELYLNIDLAQRRVHLDEKDPEYRAPIIRALASPRAA